MKGKKFTTLKAREVESYAANLASAFSEAEWFVEENKISGEARIIWMNTLHLSNYSYGWSFFLSKQRSPEGIFRSPLDFPGQTIVLSYDIFILLQIIETIK